MPRLVSHITRSPPLPVESTTATLTAAPEAPAAVTARAARRGARARCCARGHMIARKGEAFGLFQVGKLSVGSWLSQDMTCTCQHPYNIGIQGSKGSIPGLWVFFFCRQSSVLFVTVTSDGSLFSYQSLAFFLMTVRRCSRVSQRHCLPAHSWYSLVRSPCFRGWCGCG